MVIPLEKALSYVDGIRKHVERIIMNKFIESILVPCCRLKRTTRGLLCGMLSLTSAAIGLGGDFQEDNAEWEFKSGLDKIKFKEAFVELSEGGYRIYDLESYRSGRSPSVTTLWKKLPEGEKWEISMSLSIVDFMKRHEELVAEGYALIEFEAERKGAANLLFSGIWLKAKDALDTQLFLGMEELEFSNRYGEMADRGYRLIDFQAYESNGKYRSAALWTKNTEEREVRFLRGLSTADFQLAAQRLQDAGFRLLEFEGYDYLGDIAFAGSWMKLREGDQSVYEVELLPDEFYNRNLQLVNEGYRLTEFEAYGPESNLRYAGSWLKVGNGTVEKVETPKKKTMSLEAFRSGQN